MEKFFGRTVAGVLKNACKVTPTLVTFSRMQFYMNFSNLSYAKLKILRFFT